MNRQATSRISAIGRLVFWSGLVLAISCVASSGALATIEVRSFNPNEFSRIGLDITGDANPEVVSVTLKADRKVVKAAPDLVVSPNCVAVSAVRASCPRPGRASIFLGGGDDKLRLRHGVRGGYVDGWLGDDRLFGADQRDKIGGGQGDDIVHGGGRKDSVSGFTGNDRVYGDAGNDRASGGSGFDQLAGGGGNDRVDALDGQRDKSIDCGPGMDVAYIDRRLDPKPRNCETVRFRLRER